MGALALIGMGSNLGDRKAHLDAAVAALEGTPGVLVRAVSSYRETAPVGGPGGQGAFLNAAARLETTLEPEALLLALHAIEDRARRIRTVRWGERTLDLDLLLYGGLVLDLPRLQRPRPRPALRVPHPRMAVRRFVLAPLSEIAPAAVDPMTGRTVAELLANLDRRPSYVALHGEDGPTKTAIFREIAVGLGADRMRGESLRSAGADPADSCSRRLDDLEARCRALHPARWMPGERWLAGDFCLDLDLRGFLAGSPVPPGRGVGESDPVQQRGEALRSEARWALRPTFAVVLGREPARSSCPDLLDYPLLWPEATDPAGIAAEVLAACAATRAG